MERMRRGGGSKQGRKGFKQSPEEGKLSSFKATLKENNIERRWVGGLRD